jgi:hypothetical protein
VIREAIRRDDGVLHDFEGDGAQELVRGIVSQLLLSRQLLQGLLLQCVLCTRRYCINMSQRGHTFVAVLCSEFIVCELLELSVQLPHLGSLGVVDDELLEVGSSDMVS